MISIKEIMTTNIVALEKNDDLTRAEELFKKHKIRHIPVVHEDIIIGMLSYSDLLKIGHTDTSLDDRNVETIIYNMFTLEQVMSKNVITVSSDTTIKKVAEILSKEEFHALPVVDEGMLVGIVTTTDLVKYLMNQL